MLNAGKKKIKKKHNQKGYRNNCPLNLKPSNETVSGSFLFREECLFAIQLSINKKKIKFPENMYL